MRATFVGHCMRCHDLTERYQSLAYPSMTLWRRHTSHSHDRADVHEYCFGCLFVFWFFLLRPFRVVHEPKTITKEKEKEKEKEKDQRHACCSGIDGPTRMFDCSCEWDKSSSRPQNARDTDPLTAESAAVGSCERPGRGATLSPFWDGLSIMIRRWFTPYV